DATVDFFKEFAGNSILIISFDTMTHDILIEIIANSGIRCGVASNGEEAIDQLSKYYNNFNMIIINMDKEDKKGYLLAKMIRSSQSYDKIPIIAMVNEQYNQTQILKAGINAYVVKPIRLAALYTAFNLFLEKVNLGSPHIHFSQSEQILDITRGIMQTQHDYRVYLELVKEFKDAYGNSAKQFTSLIENQDYDKLRELITNMLGLSDILGANNMFILLKKLDKHIRNKEYAKLAEFIDEYNEEINALNTNIEIYIRSVDA
ncbi:MAG: response regulator, partial [Campylobacterales bacterium]|nr:response regulator [Campylobacterales bacterium]